MRRKLALPLALALILGKAPLQAGRIILPSAPQAKGAPAAAHGKHLEFQKALGEQIHRFLVMPPGQGLADLKSLALLPITDPALAHHRDAARATLHLLADPDYLSSDREHLALTLGRENIRDLESAGRSLQNVPEALGQLARARAELAAVGAGDLSSLIRSLDSIFSGSDEKEIPVLVLPSGSEPAPAAALLPALKPAEEKQAPAEAPAPPAPASAPSLLFPEDRSSDQALGLVLSEAIKSLPGGKLVRTLSRIARDHGVQLSKKDAKLLWDLRFADSERRKAPLIEALLKSLIGSSANAPERQEALAGALWSAFRGNVQTFLKTPQQYWISRLEKNIRKSLPPLENLDIAIVANKELFREMDEWVPMLFWMDPDGHTAHLRLHQAILDYIFSSDGKRRMKDFNWKSPHDLIPALVERVSFIQKLSGQINSDTGKPYTRQEIQKSLFQDPDRKLDQQKLLEVAESAAAYRSLRYKFFKWQFWLLLPVLPWALWSFVSFAKNPLTQLFVPPAGWAFWSLALAGSIFAGFAWIGPKIYDWALRKGWVVNKNKNVAYPIMMSLPWSALIYAVPLAAFFEEAIFRLSFLTGYVYSLFKPGFVPYVPVAILISSLLFAAIHFINFPLRRLTRKEVVGTSIYYLVSGIIFSLTFWFGGLFVAGMLHAIYNWILLYQEKTRLRRPENP